MLSFVLGMLLTDPSPITQLMMAFPVVGLYFLGLWSGRFVGEDAESFNLWKAWPLLFGGVVFATMLVFADELNDWAADVFGTGSTPPAKEAPIEPPAGPPAEPRGND